jgi:hypothetical protein
MKSFFRAIYMSLKGMGAARAAVLARNGDYAGAKKIMEAYGQCK